MYNDNTVINTIKCKLRSINNNYILIISHYYQLLIIRYKMYNLSKIMITVVTLI